MHISITSCSQGKDTVIVHTIIIEEQRALGDEADDALFAEDDEDDSMACENCDDEDDEDA